jgi:hypothetical protein
MNIFAFYNAEKSANSGELKFIQKYKAFFIDLVVVCQD